MKFFRLDGSDPQENGSRFLKLPCSVAGYPFACYSLPRDAFRPANPNKPVVVPGPLTDTALPVAEQEGMASLFVGAIALYKNPQSHRNVPTEAMDAAEVIVDSRQLPAPQPSPEGESRLIPTSNCNGAANLISTPTTDSLSSTRNPRVC
jgi:hypothetical protein